ncbi:Ferredoxin-related [Cinnamomum micranthum f. kanehirae]|uniref:Ferredoxin-related n=1 Tax=Cinnamomum micranthum f. kanehirae TaxID=337451 RepID=A0A443N9H3_9MAGN|nr:Ferredoxin-related [Cinnamomum micranthum f. kanehirae]
MAIAVSLLVASLFLFSASSSSSSAAAADSKSNPADELVDVLNKNRTAHKSSTLFDNPGLACVALQYIKAYQGRCDEVGPNGKKPADADFAETFAPNCGVQASTLAPITGRLLGCQSKYVDASEAFSGILVQNNRSLDIIYNKNHTEVGAAVSGSDGGSPYFWCILFSGGSRNSSFVLDGGVAKAQRPGCFSGTNDDCNGAIVHYQGLLWVTVAGVLITVASAFGL